VDVEEQYALQIAFEETGPGQGEPFIPTLEKLIDFVAKLIKPFEPFL
jgi:hypothetical protein